MAVKKWEYMTRFLPVPIAMPFQDHLNELGRAGWEVVAATFVDQSQQKTFTSIDGKPVEAITPAMCHIFFIAKRSAP